MNPGGIEAVVLELCSRISALRPSWTVRAVYAFSRITKLSRVPFACDIIAGFAAALHSLSSDVLLINGAEYAWLVSLIPALRRKVIVVWHGTRAFEVPALTPHMNFYVRTYLQLEIALQRLALLCPAHIVVSPRVNEELARTYRGAGPFPVILNGAPSIDNLPPSTPPQDRLLWVGTSPYKKGLDIAIAACGMARTAGANLRLVVCGIPADSDHREPWTEFLGHVSRQKVRELLRGSRALLAATRYEACSMAVLEAMALGVPVVGSPAVAWMLPAEMQVPDWNPDSFARVIVSLYRDPHAAERAGLSELAAIQQFDWDRASREYARIIESTQAVGA